MCRNIHGSSSIVSRRVGRGVLRERLEVKTVAQSNDHDPYVGKRHEFLSYELLMIGLVCHACSGVLETDMACILERRQMDMFNASENITSPMDLAWHISLDIPKVKSIFQVSMSLSPSVSIADIISNINLYS